MIHVFGGFELDEGLYELRRGGTEIKLRRKSFEVLVHLLRNAGRVVSKDELIERIWQGAAVSETSLPNCVSEIRAALGDSRNGGLVIQTIYGRGYRFVAKRESGKAVAGGPAAAEAGAVEDAEQSPQRVFVGRRRELARLERALDDATAGVARVALLHGEPGIGKTRLAERLAERAAQRGARVLTARCDRNGAPALWPWVEMLRRELDESELGPLCQAAGSDVGEIATLIPDAAVEGAASDPKHAGSVRARLFHALRDVVAALSRRTPCVIVIDDLQRADQSSLMLLRFVARELRAERVLVVGILEAIPRSREHPLTRLVADLKHEVAAETIQVPPLAPAEVAEFVERARGRPLQAGLVSVIEARTEGHPLFLRELVELLEEEGSSSGGGPPAIPAGVRDVLQLRFDRLHKSCRRVLEVAAVGGREFSVTLVQRVAEVDALACLDELERAVEAGVVREIAPHQHPGTYRFTHGLLRDVLYDGLAARDRVEIHRRYGRELEARRSAPGEIAQHLAKSNDPADLERALQLSMRAGRRAARNGAHDLAATHYERARAVLADLGRGDGQERCDLLLACAAALRWSHQYSRAQEVLRQAIECARSLNASDRLAGAALVWSGPDTIGTVDHTRIHLIEEALRGLDAEESELRVYLLLCRIAARWSLEPPERTLEQARELIAMAERQELGLVRIIARWFVHGCLQSVEQLEERREVRDEALRLAAAQPDRGMEIITRVVLLGDLVESGDAPGLDREIRTIEGLAAHGGDIPVLWATGMRALLRGELAEAEGRLTQVWGDTQFSPRGVACPPGFACQMFELRREQGRLAELESLVRAGRAQMPAFGPWQALLALLLHETDRDEEAARELARVFEVGLERLPRNAFWLGGLVYLAEVAAARGTKADASGLYRILEPFHDRVAMMHGFACAGPVGLALARLATVCGWRRRAEQHLATAHALALRLRAAPSLARIEQARSALAG